MATLRMDHVGIVVDDLAAAKAFFAVLGLDVQGERPVAGSDVDRLVDLEGVRADIAFLRTPDGGGVVELVKFHAPAPAHGNATCAAVNVPGLRHLAFTVEDLDAIVADLRAGGAELVGDVVRGARTRLCFVRGPDGLIVELMEPIV